MFLQSTCQHISGERSVYPQGQLTLFSVINPSSKLEGSLRRSTRVSHRCVWMTHHQPAVSQRAACNWLPAYDRRWLYGLHNSHLRLITKCIVRDNTAKAWWRRLSEAMAPRYDVKLNLSSPLIPAPIRSDLTRRKSSTICVLA